jgi:hypothetical protein
MSEREEQLQKMLTGGIKAQWERLNDPKNAIKGKFTEDIGDAVDNIEEEYEELFDELNINFDYKRIREEAADLKNYLDNLIMICDKEIAENNQKQK